MAHISPLRMEKMANEWLYTTEHSCQISCQCGLTATFAVPAQGDNGHIVLIPYQSTTKGKELVAALNEQALDIVAAVESLDVHATVAAENDGKRGWRIENDMYVCLVVYNDSDQTMSGKMYFREWFEDHLRVASKGIRFVTPHYETKFVIPDGGRIYIDGSEHACRYIDGYHLFVDHMCFHICEFGERMARRNLWSPDAL